jgi:hypothetical protein
MTAVGTAAAVASSVWLAGLMSVSSPIDFDGKAEKDSINVSAIDPAAAGAGPGARNTDGSATSVERRAALGSKCAVGDTIVSSSLVDPCAAGQLASSISFECAPGEVKRDPVAERTWVNNPDGTVQQVSDWKLVSTYDCLSPADLTALVQTEFARLPLAPSPLTIQPSRGWTLVNVDTITYTSADPQVFTTTLLGVPVTIEAVPAGYSWDYGDDTTPLATTDPGHPDPHHTVAHVYEKPATATITLTTTWTGRFQITGTTTWTPVTGTATTTTTAPPLTIHEARSRLVTDPLD